MDKTVKPQTLIILVAAFSLTLIFGRAAVDTPFPGTVLHSPVPHGSGIPLGGIGTGSVEIRPDGTLDEWQIFNLGRWASEEPEQFKALNPAMKLDFYLRLAGAGAGADASPILRRLSVSPDGLDLYGLAWLKNVQAVDFTGDFPVADLRYRDESLPVTVSATYCSPFIPHDSRASGTPGFYAVFHFKNESARPVEVSLLGIMANPLAWGVAERRLTNSVRQRDGVTCLTMRTAAEAEYKQTVGSMSFSVIGGQASWIAGDFPSFLNTAATWWTRGAYGNVYESLLSDFRAGGRLPNLGAGTSPEAWLKLTDDQIAALPLDQKREWAGKLRAYAIFDSLARRVLAVEPKALDTEPGLATFLSECRDRLDAICGKNRETQRWGDGALCSTLTLQSGESKDVQFALSWHFPYHYSGLGSLLGHMYENWYTDSEEVNRFLTGRSAELIDQTRRFSDTLYRTSLGAEMADAWSAQLSTMVKTTWWVKNGDFGVWEGLGCCGFHTTDITYQGSFGLLALFPDLQMRQMEMGARFQRADGRVHHFFTPDFSKVDNGFDRVDMNPQFVLLVCRDYLWTGDRGYLQRMWPSVVKALANTAQLDGDGDGLPDHDTRRNTYDAWNFYGTPSYIASLWLAGLKAGVRLATDLGEAAQAQKWQAVLDQGVRSFDRKLWNGEYFSLWVDGARRDECCMTDQLSGEWFNQLAGVGHSLPLERVLAALTAVFKHNFSREGGLINASYPPGKTLQFSTYRNGQAEAPWTGIEYAMASMMLEFGMADEARAVVSAVHDRYLRAGRRWSHVECGSHYYRAMSSWAVLLSAAGFKMDAPHGTVTFAPVAVGGKFAAPWVSATGWGTFTTEGNHFLLSNEDGRLAFKNLRLRLPAGATTLTLNGSKVPVKIHRQDGLTIVEPDREIVLKSGDHLAVE